MVIAPQFKGLWRLHVAFAAVATVAAASVYGFAVRVWLPAALIGVATLLGCLALFPLWPQIRFKPQVRTLELDGSGYRTSIGRIRGARPMV